MPLSSSDKATLEQKVSVFLTAAGALVAGPLTAAQRDDLAAQVASMRTFVDALAADASPAPQPQPAVPIAGMEVALDFGNGSVAKFTDANAVDMGDFVGEFVHQKCFMALDPAFPLWSVFFRPDADGSRDEVVVEYGTRQVGGPIVNVVTPYTATISKGGAQVYQTVVPCHWYFSRWRWQSAWRPVVRSPSVLRSRKWLPNFGPAGMFGTSGPTVTQTWQGPMTVPYYTEPRWTMTGSQLELGWLSEAGAQYMIFETQNALDSSRCFDEGFGTVAFHFRNADGTAINPRTSFLKGYGGDIEDPGPYAPALGDPLSLTNYQVPNAAHIHASAIAGWMSTDDPYLLEELQFCTTWALLVNGQRTKSEVDAGYGAGLFWKSEQRVVAWGLRNTVYLATTTPDATPAWVMPRSAWIANLADNLVMAQEYANAPPGSRLISYFRTWPVAGINDTWQGAWLAHATGLAAEAGHAGWQDVFEWAIGAHIAMTDGASGWGDWDLIPYESFFTRATSHETVQGPWISDPNGLPEQYACADWADAYAYYLSGSVDRLGTPRADARYFPVGHGSQYVTDLDKWNGIPVGNIEYYLSLRAVLAQGVNTNVPGALACYNKVQAILPKKMAADNIASSIARYSIDPIAA